MGRLKKILPSPVYGWLANAYDRRLKRESDKRDARLIAAAKAARGGLMQQMVTRMRAKDRIEVLFVVWDIAGWNLESLFLAMRANGRFHPVIGVEKDMQSHGEAAVKAMCEERGYDHVVLDAGKTIAEQVGPDLVFYEKGYNDLIQKKHQYIAKRIGDYLICYVAYGFYVNKLAFSYENPMFLSSFLSFVENEDLREELSEVSSGRGVNVRVTGTPVVDFMVAPKEQIADPWKDTKGRKRIVWAPHHTIGNMHSEGMGLSTFLEYCDYMLEMAKETADTCYYAFKPHPVLRQNLVAMWGEERTAAYYKAWEELENGQLENGEYVGLFKYSDAMIHDCSSFVVAYQYAQKPCLFLRRDGKFPSDLWRYAGRALALHEVADSQAEIRSFVDSVVRGEDAKREARAKYYEECLLPPNGKTACQNIIDAILGE